MRIERQHGSPRPARWALRAVSSLAALMVASSVCAVDWSAVKEREVPLFYPGQASWEWVMTSADHSGAAKFREGKNCRACHDGEQQDMGEAIAGGGHLLEPAPIAGKPGSATLRVKAARSNGRLYFRLRWKPAVATETKTDGFAAHITVMLDDGGLRESARAGCWASCHDDAIGMASAAPGSKTSKYLGASRVKLTRQGGGDAHKSAAELDDLLAQNTFLEYWQARLNPGQQAKAVSGYILERRHEHDPVAVTAEAEFTDGEWQVTLSRALESGGPTQKALVAGKTYAVGFALHDNHAEHRFHFVSLEYSLQLDTGSADFIAAGQ